MYRNNLAPDYIKNNKHDDWPWPFSKIPRIWTFYGFDMPPHKVAGTMKPSWHMIEPDYPLAPDALVVNTLSPAGIINKQVISMDPSGPTGQWSIQSVYFWGHRWPCFFCGAWQVFGRRLYVNFGLKPDVTYNDNGVKNWNWAFPEASLTWTK